MTLLCGRCPCPQFYVFHNDDCLRWSWFRFKLDKYLLIFSSVIFMKFSLWFELLFILRIDQIVLIVVFRFRGIDVLCLLVLMGPRCSAHVTRGILETGFLLPPQQQDLTDAHRLACCLPVLTALPFSSPLWPVLKVRTHSQQRVKE